jgi:hypothetical protein
LPQIPETLLLLQDFSTEPDGALEDPQSFINLARSTPQVMAGLPPHLQQAVNQNDVETLQRFFRFVHPAHLWPEFGL